MTFRGYSMLFTCALFALAGWAVWEASHWPIQASLMAWIIGVPTVLFLGVELIREVRGKVDAENDATNPAIPLNVMPQETDETVDPEEQRRRTVAIIGWIAGFGVAIWLLGFHTGITLLTLLYLRCAGETWATTLGLSTAVWLVTTYFFDCTMHIFFAEGKLFAWIGISSNQFYTGACQVFSGLFK